MCAVRKAPTSGLQYMSAEMYGSVFYILEGYPQPSPWAVQKFDTATDLWLSVNRIPTRRIQALSTYGASAGTVGSKIFVAGGNPPGIPSPAVMEAYLPVTDTWESVNFMPVGCVAHGSAVWDTVFLLAGGYPKRTVLQLYQATTDTWNTGKRLPSATPHAITRLCTLNGRVLCRQQHAHLAALDRGLG